MKGKCAKSHQNWSHLVISRFLLRRLRRLHVSFGTLSRGRTSCVFLVRLPDTYASSLQAQLTDSISLDPEDYTNYRVVVVAVDFPREESADAVRLGKYIPFHLLHLL